jgi:hypothetical protein
MDLQRNSNLNLCRKAFITMSYIRPMLAYNSLVWNPTKSYLIDLVESVQRKFSKRIILLSKLPYTERLARLGLESFDVIDVFVLISQTTSKSTPITPCDHITS